MTNRSGKDKGIKEEPAINQNPANPETATHSSGYGGMYEGSSKRGESSDWYGETEKKDLPADSNAKNSKHSH